MLTPSQTPRWLSITRVLAALGLLILWPLARAGTTPASNPVEVITIQGTAEVARAGQTGPTVWDLASTQLPYRRLHPGDQIRTKDHSRATIRLSDLTLVELGPNAHFELLPLREQRPAFGLLRGLLYLFHRDKPGEFYFRTPTASPVIRGTEFTLEVAEDGGTTLHLLDGEVALTNNLGQLDLKSGESASVQPGQAPVRVAALEAANVIQWRLYYPAVLHVEELQLSAEEQGALAGSLAAYRQGDLLKALASWPAGRQPGSDREKVYYAQLLLAVGEVGGAEKMLDSLSGSDQRAKLLATALRTLIAAVKFQPTPPVDLTITPASPASSLLAGSYYRQSRFDLDRSLYSARAAVEAAPDFAFGWARVAELELSFGRSGPAMTALDHALELAPRNAQALAVKGFLLASQKHTGAALAIFEQAIAVDPALGNAWLGRGLCRIRQGDIQGGTADLLAAAALEPNRALLRSYVGKAFNLAGNEERAGRELERARELDPNDPTAWLYSALLNQQENRLNDAIRELERSEQLNDNRQLYRSRLLLDQDLAVRQANLAAIYQDAGLFDQSVREAARAVTSDYANYSAHLFLANSYSQQRDPNSANLRYETVALNEYLVAELLAPVGGSALSPYVSQQEYSPLFERKGLGIASGTQYTSRGDWQQHGVLYGTADHFDAAFDAYYASQNGQRANNDFTLRSLAPAARGQIGPQDTLFVQVVSTEFESGDLRQYYDQASADQGLRIKESQEPNVFLGYHHQWAPGSHTLVLLGRLNDDFRLSDPTVFIPTFRADFSGIFGSVPPAFSQFSDEQRSQLTAYSAELQQIWQSANNTLVLGGRYQDTGLLDGEIQSDVQLTKLPPNFGNLTYPPGTQHTETQLRREVIYAYDSLQIAEPCWIIGGVSYDWMSFPENTDLPPITDAQTHKDQVSPKAGFVLLPTTNMVARFAYTRSLGGLYYDTSVRLEPAQVAGFNQAFRSLIPESVAGLVPGSKFETADFDYSWRLPTDTYLGVGLEWLWSDADQNQGAFVSSVFTPTVMATTTPEELKFEEKSVTANVNQLLGRDWALGARYRFSDADLQQRLTEVPVSAGSFASVENSGKLHQLTLSAALAHPVGFFAEAQSLWYLQQGQNHPQEEFWQFNVFAGYRFAKRRVELLVGGLNLGNQDYKLDPINFYSELPRARTLLVSFKFNF